MSTIPENHDNYADMLRHGEIIAQRWKARAGQRLVVSDRDLRCLIVDVAEALTLVAAGELTVPAVKEAADA